MIINVIKMYMIIVIYIQLDIYINNNSYKYFWKIYIINKYVVCFSVK